MERDDLLRAIHAERGRLDGALARVPDERMADRADEGTWTGKDHLAHLASWQRVAAARATGTAADDVADVVRGEYTEETIDAVNERFHQAGRARPLDEVRAGFASSYDRLWGAIEGMTDEDLAREWLPGHPERGTMRQTIEANTTEHYPDHLRVFESLAKI